MRFLVIGHLTRDIIIKAGKCFERAGGGAYYSALALSRFGEVTVLTKLGGDFPGEFLNGFKEKVELVVLPSNKSTTYELRYLNDDERILKLLARGDEIAPHELPDLRRFDLILANPVAREIPVETLEILKGHSLAVDLQGFVREFRDGVEIGEMDPGYLRGVKILHADINEVSALGSLENAISILKNNVEVALISDGSNRGIALWREKIYAYYPPEINVKDSTGAGDTFLAAFSYFYGKYPFIQALKMANAFTALFLERRGYDFTGDAISKKALEVRVEEVSTCRSRVSIP